MKKRKVLVTGGNGFVGSHLVRFLIEKGDEVTVFKGDLRFSRLDFRKYDQVYHLAAKTASAMKDGADDLYSNNIESTRRVVAACEKAKARLLFVSSGEVLFKGSWSDRRALYTASKSAGEGFCFASGYDDWVIARLANPYGPGQPEHYALPTFIRGMYEEGVVSVQNGSDTRSLIYITDAVEALYNLMNNPACSRGSWTVCSNEEVMVGTIAQMIQVAFMKHGINTRVQIPESSTAERRFYLNTPATKVSIVNGIQMMVDNFMNNQANKQAHGTESQVTSEQQKGDRSESSRARKSKKSASKKARKIKNV